MNLDAKIPDWIEKALWWVCVVLVIAAAAQWTIN